MVSNSTEYGKRIQIELVKREKTKEWLIGEIRAKTGMYVDRSNLNKIIAGKIKSSRLTDAINEILEISEEGKT